jgi:DNA-binding CsgD family transcriptional regulator
MTVVLSAQDVARFDDAVEVLLSSSEYSDVDRWAAAVVRATHRFVRSDTAVLRLATAAGSREWAAGTHGAGMAAERGIVVARVRAGVRRLDHVFLQETAASVPYRIGLLLRLAAAEAELAWTYAVARVDPFGGRQGQFEAAALLLPACRIGFQLALARPVVSPDDDHRVALPPVGELMSVHGLTRRQAQVALLLAAGASDQEVAQQLIISRHTARKHAEHIFSKLNVHTRKAIGLTLLAARRPMAHRSEYAP